MIKLLAIFLYSILILSCGSEEFPADITQDNDTQARTKLNDSNIEESFSLSIFKHEAEDENAILYSTVIRDNHAGYFGTGFADFNGENSSISWEVDYPAGIYQFKIRYGSGSTRPSTLIINGSHKLDLELKIQGEQSWINWVTETTEDLTIENPIKTITIAADGKSSGPNLDEIEVIRIGSITETIAAGESKTLQAEDARAFNVTEMQNHPGYMGTGFMDFEKEGSHLEWSELNLSPGQYRLVFRYGGGKTRPSNLIVNGVTQNQNVFGDNSYDLSFKQHESGSWGQWMKEEITIDTAGEILNSLIVHADKSSGTNLDQIEIFSIQSSDNINEQVDQANQKGEMINQPKLMASGDFFEALNGSEGIENIFDNNPKTKWLHKAKSSDIRLDFPSAFVLEEYYLTSANDVPGRDPSQWILLGSNNPNDLKSWKKIDTRQGVVFEQRHQEKGFALTNHQTAYKSYMFYDIKNSGSSYIQLAEIRFKAKASSQTLGATQCEHPWEQRPANNISLCVLIDSNNPSFFDSVLITDEKNSDIDNENPDHHNEENNDNDNDDVVSQVILPIEVLGPKGTEKTVDLDVSDSSDITHMYIQCNSCGYRNNSLDSDPSMVKATVSINGRTPIELKAYTGRGEVIGNKSIKFLGPEASYGGIGGGMRSVEFIVPIQGIITGRNTLKFEHRDPGSPSIGYRIIKLNLVRDNDPTNLVLEPEDFIDDDPSTWAAPLASAEDFEQGKYLWNKRGHLYDEGLDLLDGQSEGQGFKNGMMKASCADCHAKDGRDLAYFNFSNHSIIERSKFHRLSEKAGKQIASYIRSLDIPVVKQARPWNPPYQPGPGLDDKPAYEWAAGAGLDAVLKNDAEMKPYLFPNGTSIREVKDVVDRFSSLNMRELPVALQMTDWNSWLPIIHPSDAFDESRPAIYSDYRGRNVGKPYYTYLYEQMQDDPSPYNLGEMTSRIRSWLSRGSSCYTQNVAPGGTGWRPVNSLVGDAQILSEIFVPSSDSLQECDSKRRNIEFTRGFEAAKRGLHSWINIKLWEIIHGNDLETRSLEVSKNICAGSDCIDASEPRGWVLTGHSATPMAFFSRAPHYIAYNSANFTDQDPIVGRYEGNVWYHFQLIMDPGYRNTAPSHFAYTIGHTEKLNNESGESQSFRFWSAMIKMRQMQTNGRYGKENGLDLRTAQPFRYFADKRGNPSGRDGVGTDLWAKLISAFIEDLVADAKYASQAEWDAANQNRAVQDRDSRDFSYYSDKNRPFKDEKLQGKNTVRVIPEFKNIGVRSSSIDQLLDWCESMWPFGTWEQLR